MRNDIDEYLTKLIYFVVKEPCHQINIPYNNSKRFILNRYHSQKPLINDFHSQKMQKCKWNNEDDATFDQYLCKTEEN